MIMCGTLGLQQRRSWTVKGRGRGDETRGRSKCEGKKEKCFGRSVVKCKKFGKLLA